MLRYVNCVSLSGPFNGCHLCLPTAQGFGRTSVGHIVWSSKSDLPGEYGTNYRVKVIADDVGMTWVYRHIWLRGISNEEKDGDFWAINCEIWDNPYIPDDEKKKFLDKITDPLMRQIAEKGSWVEFHGLVWPSFNRIEHTHKPFPLEWDVEGEDTKVQPTRYMAIDPMDRLIACLWIAVYPNGRVVVYNEALIENATPKEIAVTLIMVGDEKAVFTPVLNPPPPEAVAVTFLITGEFS